MTYTITPTPTTRKVVRNPGIRAALTARAEANARAEQWAAQDNDARNRMIADAIACYAKDLLVKRSA